mgnify:CR=1 FL=1
MAIRKQPPDDYSENFSAFWSAYPRRVAKLDAWKAWLRQNCDSRLEEILTSVEDHCQWPQWTDGDGLYIPYPATFLNGRRWEDDLRYPTVAEIQSKERDIQDEAVAQAHRVVSALTLLKGGKQ